MRVALIYQHVDPSRGGAETYVVDLARALVKHGCEVEIHAETVAPGVLPAQARFCPVSVEGKTRLARLASFARESERALHAAGVDCAVGFIGTHAQDVLIPQGGVQAASILANAGRRRAALGRGLYVLGKALNPKFWRQRATERKQYDPRRGSRIVAVSRMVARHLETFHHVPLHRIHVVHNAIDPERMRLPDPAAARAEARTALGLGPHALAALFAGHNYALKGLGELIQAMGLRRRQNPGAVPIHLIVTGGGNDRPYRKLARRLGIANEVHFLGFQDDVRPWFAASDFFAQPTHYDPCSLVLLEALAYGLPVISTRRNGASELVADGVHGWIVNEPSDISGLAAALERMADPAGRSAMAHQARELGAELTFDAHVRKLIAIFEEVAAVKARRRERGSSALERAGMPHFARQKAHAG